jgi:adenosylmethionine-8-amino-7-oxononanoate aminotransferase
MTTTRAVEQLAKIDHEHLIHPLQHPEEHTQPVIWERGEGALLWDVNGKEYIDGLSGLWNVNVGHGRAELAEAAAEQMRRLAFASNYSGLANEPAIRLAHRLSQIAYPTLNTTYFTTGGAESNETAFKTARFYWKARGKPSKVKVISREHAYHGVTLAAMSATGLAPFWKMFEPRVPGFLHIPSPYPYRFAHQKPGKSDGLAAADLLEEAILREGADTVAAFIAEPVMGAGGVLVPPATYFERVQEVLRKHDVLLIADEVICGFGRTGRMFGSETFGLRPDIVVMAKALSSGYLPISATAISEPIYQALLSQSDRLGYFAHGHTYGGHPAACAVALEALRLYEERDIVGHVQRVGPRLQAGLRRLADHPLVGDVRGVGLIAGVELVRDRASRAAFDPPGSAGLTFQARAQERGLIVRGLQDTVALCPPLIITESEVDELLARFEAALEDTGAALAAGT